MKFPILVGALCVFACHSAADESMPQELKEKLLTVFPGHLEKYQFEAVTPNSDSLITCFLADEKMQHYPKDLALQAILKIINNPELFTRRTSTKSIIATAMTTKDLIELGAPAIALFLLFDHKKITLSPGYNEQKDAIYYGIGQYERKPELLILDSKEKDVHVREMAVILNDSATVTELQRRGEFRAVDTIRKAWLEKKNFDIAVRINHRELESHFNNTGGSCIIS